MDDWQDRVSAMSGSSPFNLAITKIAARAEKRDAELLRETFVESGVGEQLDTIDHQVLYGRRGTGKTHAVTFLASEVRTRGDIAINIDLRTIGSGEGLFGPDPTPITQRASRLLVDLLIQVREGFENAYLEDESLIAEDMFVTRLDELLVAITNVQVNGEVEQSVETEQKDARKNGGALKVGINPKPSAEVSFTEEQSQEGRNLLRETRRGAEKIHLNFGDVARALRALAKTLSSRRIWLILDEWSSVPREVQPYLAEFLLRCVFPLQAFTVKITAIEQQSSFRVQVDGNTIGFELGADVSATLALDDFLVFERNEEYARDFFVNLFFKHLTADSDDIPKVEGLELPKDVIKLGFTDVRAFDELVMAAEGVPRDAIYIVRRAAIRSRQNLISVPSVREAARYWYQTDKSAAIASNIEANRLLRWIIEKVIREKKARGFLVNEAYAQNPVLLALFDARILHVVRRGYSAQDQPGERFDVWVIDYGAYVDLISTVSAPQGLLPFDDVDGSEGFIDIDVPVQDLRAIRRAILDIEEFTASA
ncbi:hypothetical protein [Nocardia wallacei]|uniref:hypothetical protein n=1 Tax=Nocardia wallacei TaxID=480035 RepID=UPI002454F6F7|nr:hypothetical protein [Nocardia wallacei]